MRLRQPALILAAALAATPVARAAAQTPPSGDDTVVARRGALTLTAGQVRDMVRAADPEARRQLQADPQALVRAVRDRLIALSVLAEAHAHQWDTRPDVIARADLARDAAIGDSYIASIATPDPAFPSDAQVQAAYEANKSRLMLPRQYHVAQIFLAVPAAAPPSADAEAQKRLADLRSQVTARRGDFATLARKLSDDHGSAPAGGDLGWVREDQLLPVVRNAVTGLTDGGLSDPVRAGDGWHLIRMLGTRPAAPAAPADVHDGLVRALRQQKAQENARAWLDGLLKQEPLQINELALPALAGK